MSAYVVFVVDDEFDKEKMAAYRSTGRDTLAGRGARLLSLPSCQLETLEGEPAQTLVLMEFPSYEEARDWYCSDDYQTHAQLRLSASRGRTFLVDGVDVPI